MEFPFQFPLEGLESTKIFLILIRNNTYSTQVRYLHTSAVLNQKVCVAIVCIVGDMGSILAPDNSSVHI